MPGKSNNNAATVVARRYVKINAAADYLGVHHQTIRKLISDGRIQAFRYGTRLIRVDLNELDALLADGGVS